MPGKASVSRGEDLLSKDFDLEFPPIDEAYIVDWLFELGPTGHGFSGPVGISWQELAHWQDLTAYEVDPYEAEALVRMSRAYAAELNSAQDPKARPPYVPEGEEEEAEYKYKAQIARGISSMFRNAASSRKDQ